MTTPLVLERPYLWQWDASRYKRAYLYGKIPEDRVQKEVVDALAMLGLHLEVIDAGAAALRGKFYGALCRAGIPEPRARAILADVKNISAAAVGRTDLSGTLAPEGRSVFLEVKAPAWVNPLTGGQLRAAGKPTQDQLAYMDAKVRAGAIVGVVWSVQDALDVVGQHRLAAHRRCCGL